MQLPLHQCISFANTSVYTTMKKSHTNYLISYHNKLTDDFLKNCFYHVWTGV